LDSARLSLAHFQRPLHWLQQKSKRYSHRESFGKPTSMDLFWDTGCLDFGVQISLDNANKKSMVYGGHKVIANYGVNKNSGEDFVFYEMYDVLADPDELIDISKQKPILFGYLRTELEKWARQQSERRSVLKKPKEAVLDDETKEILRSLGYLQ
jgi:hypothetical protein